MSYYRRAAPKVVYNEEDKQLCARLYAALDRLPAKDHSFAASLIESCANYGSLTPGRREWVGRLIERAENPPPPAEAVEVDLSGVRKMFDAAVTQLRHPRVRLRADDGTPVVIGIAGPASKYAGQLMVTDGGPYGANRWFGRVEGSQFHPSRSCEGSVRGLLTSLSADPAQIVAGYGRLTGCCALCGKQLSDAESIERGVGPVCLKKWGLAGPLPKRAGVPDFAPTVMLD